MTRSLWSLTRTSKHLKPSNNSTIFTASEYWLSTLLPDLNYKYLLIIRKSIEWREDVSRYKKCLRPFPAQIFAMVINNMKKTWKTFCFSEENKNTAFNHLKCVTPETHPKFQEAGYMIISMVDYVSRLKDLDEAIPSLCCGAHKLVARIEKHLEATCSTVGKKGSGKWMTEAAWSMLSDTMDMLCGNYENIADCHSKVPEIVAKVEAATKSEAISNSTVVTPFVRLIKRLDKQLTGQ